MSNATVIFVPPPPTIPASEYILVSALAFFIYSVSLLVSAKLLVSLIESDEKEKPGCNGKEKGT